MNRKLAIIALVALAIGFFFAFDLGRYFDLAYLKSQQAAFAAFYASHPAATIAAYFLLYVAVAALSLPGAVVLTLAGGALFGFWVGLIVVSFASSLGALLAMLAARLVLGESVQRRFGAQLAAINAGIARDGPFYLFALRLVPIFPFFVINLLMGLTKIRASTFYWVSQLGHAAGHSGVRQRRHAAGTAGVPARSAVARTAAVIRAARRLSLDREEGRRPPQGAQGLRSMGGPQAFVLRLQHGRYRRRVRRTGFRLHRRRHQGESRAGRTAPDGRRLPQHRVRAEQGADPLGQAAVAHRAIEVVGYRRSEREIRLR